MTDVFERIDQSLDAIAKNGLSAIGIYLDIVDFHFVVLDMLSGLIKRHPHGVYKHVPIYPVEAGPSYIEVQAPGSAELGTVSLGLPVGAPLHS